MRTQRSRMNPTTYRANPSEPNDLGRTERPLGRTQVTPTTPHEPNDTQGKRELSQQTRMNPTTQREESIELNDPRKIQRPPGRTRVDPTTPYEPNYHQGKPECPKGGIQVNQKTPDEFNDPQARVKPMTPDEPNDPHGKPE